jgi:hypothetical protein
MTRRERNAVATGCDELFNRLTWTLRKNPKKLREAKKLYRLFCIELAAQIDEAGR